MGSVSSPLYWWRNWGSGILLRWHRAPSWQAAPSHLPRTSIAHLIMTHEALHDWAPPPHPSSLTGYLSEAQTTPQGLCIFCSFCLECSTHSFLARFSFIQELQFITHTNKGSHPPNNTHTHYITYYVTLIIIWNYLYSLFIYLLIISLTRTWAPRRQERTCCFSLYLWSLQDLGGSANTCRTNEHSSGPGTQVQVYIMFYFFKILFIYF